MMSLSLFIDGHKFSSYMTRETIAFGFCIYWQCCVCKAKTTTDREGNRRDRSEIVHRSACFPDTDVERISKVRSEFREKVKENVFTPTAVMVDGLRTALPAHLQSALPKKETLKRNVRHIRASARAHLPLVVNRMFDFADEYEMITVREGEQEQLFLRFDSGPSENRFLIFSTDNLPDVLQKSKTWLIDGTFKICPEIFHPWNWI